MYVVFCHTARFICQIFRTVKFCLTFTCKNDKTDIEKWTSLKGENVLCNTVLKFVFPVDGDCLNLHDGKCENESLIVTVRLCAGENHEIFVCGKKAEYKDGLYCADVCLSGFRTTLVAEDKTSGECEKISVFRLNDAVGKYRVSSDDNILFLQDLTKNKDVYKSIFENPYLAVYKKAHDLYGAKVHLNLFYEFIPTDDFKKHTEYFNLTMMTDKFKEEFKANSDWLKLAFHAKSEYPDVPYKNTTRQKITEDCIDVCREIIRFAGKECINDTTTIHWGEVNREGVRALRALGFKSLTGYLTVSSDGTPIVSYYLDKEQAKHADTRDFWYDKDEDMMFARIDLVTNIGTYDWVMSQIKEIAAHPNRGGFVSTMIHEQYFYDDYNGYLADFESRVLDVCKYLYDNGYKGCHISDVVAEKHLCDNELF